MTLQVARLTTILISISLACVGAALALGDMLPDGGTMAVSGWVGSPPLGTPDHPMLFLLDLRTMRVQVLDTQHYFNPLFWLANGEELIARSNALYRVDFNTGELNVLHPLPDLYTPAGFQANGTVILQSSQEVALYDPLNARVTRTFALGSGVYLQPNWSPDSRYVAYSGVDTYHIVDTQTGQFVDSPLADAGLWLNLPWSPRGRYGLLVSPGREMIVFEMATGFWRHVPGVPLAWSPDEASLLLGSGNTLLSRFDIVDGSQYPVLSLPPYVRTSNFQWSPDGAHIAFTATDPNSGSELYIMDADGGHLRPLLSPTFGVIVGSAVFAWRPIS